MVMQTHVIVNVCLHLYLLRSLKRFSVSLNTLTNFYRYTVESITTGYVMAWYDNSNALELKKLQRVVDSAQKIMGTALPYIER